MSATTRVFLNANDGEQYVSSSDPATPIAHVTDSRAHCPRCDAAVLLQDETGLDYQLHYYAEHTRPAIRYEETAS